MIRPVSYSVLMADPHYPQLIAEYGAECSIPEIGRINPQPDLYATLEQSGGFHLFGVYGGETLIGFVSLLIYVLPHYGVKVATTESIFLASAHRHSDTGTKMLEFIEAFAKEQGCKVMLYTAPLEGRFARLLMCKHRCTNLVFVESL